MGWIDLGPASLNFHADVAQWIADKAMNAATGKLTERQRIAVHEELHQNTERIRRSATNAVIMQGGGDEEIRRVQEIISEEMQNAHAEIDRVIESAQAVPNLADRVKGWLAAGGVSIAIVALLALVLYVGAVIPRRN